MKVKEIKTKLYQLKNILIWSDHSDIINDHKTQGEWKVHSVNTVIDYKTQRERKIQLTMTINFISCKDSNETRTIYTKSNNI